MKNHILDLRFSILKNSGLKLPQDIIPDISDPKNLQIMRTPKISLIKLHSGQPIILNSSLPLGFCTNSDGR